jgi:hypothetical protein
MEFEVSVTHIAEMFRNNDQTFNFKIPPKENTQNILLQPERFKRNGLAASLASSNTQKRVNAQKRLGLKQENVMLNVYEKMKKCTVEDRNSITVKHTFEGVNDHKISVVGRMDGINVTDKIIVEHKTRMRGFLSYVPKHEVIQCHLYMKMAGFERCDLVESFGEHIKIHTIEFNQDIWHEIVTRITHASDFIQKK